MEQIIQTGTVTRGWLGAGVLELNAEVVDAFKLGDVKGVLITEIIRNSPAEQAGIKTGDVLMAIDDKPIEEWNAMLEIVANLPPGKIVVAQLMRNGNPLNINVKIGKRPKPKAQ
jgi:serine protease DegQ